MRSIPDRPVLGSRARRRSSRQKVRPQLLTKLCCRPHLSVAVSKKQYESGASSEKKQHALEVNKVSHVTLPSFALMLMFSPRSPSAISFLA